MKYFWSKKDFQNGLFLEIYAEVWKFQYEYINFSLNIFQKQPFSSTLFQKIWVILWRALMNISLLAYFW